MREPDRQYEPDLSRPGPFWWVLVLTTVGILALSALIRGVFSDTSSPAGTLEATVTEADPAPQLQSAPLADYEQFHQKASQTLNSVGWVDRDAGVVYMPIDRAMELLVERGLPEEQP